MKKRFRPVVSAKKKDNQECSVPTAPGSVRLAMFSISESTVPPSQQFIRCQGADMSVFDKLSVSGANGVFNPVPVQLPVLKYEDTCELCAPIEKATVGIICTGCQKLLDEGLADIVKIPAYFVPEYNDLDLLYNNGKVKEYVWTENTTNYNPSYTWWEQSTESPKTGVVKAPMPC
jgi:hypothetical protein